jgi:hypothetical protein
MVHDSISQRKGEDYKGCITTCAVQTDTHVQLPRVQRCAGLISTGTSSAVSHHVLADEKLCSIDSKVVYRRYASLFFIAGCASTDNELITLEIVHRYVEQMDKYYGNVCELDIIFNFQKAYFILDELLLAGEMQESSKKNVLRCISQEDSLEDMEVSQEKSPLPSRIKSISNVAVSGTSPICPLPPQTNSACLPPRSRKTSQKLGERVAKRWLPHHPGAHLA